MQELLYTRNSQDQGSKLNTQSMKPGFKSQEEQELQHPRMDIHFHLMSPALYSREDSISIVKMKSWKEF